MLTEDQGRTASQVNKAGRTVRRWSRGDERRSEQLLLALGVIRSYRAAHQYSLAKATMGLRSAVRTEGCPVEVSQRLKRLVTIVDKVTREPTMALANMQDIGGCRAVLGSVEELRRVEHRIRRNRTALRVADYISAPRTSGYRGVHVVVTYPDRSGYDRAIEMQLRTRTMHEWAISVERLSGRLKEDLKSGYGPVELLDLLSAISEAMAIEEQGGVVPGYLLEQMSELRKRALPYLNGGVR